MEIVGLAIIIAGAIAGIIGAVVILRKISAFYKQRFNFSIWSGVLLFTLALALVVIAGSGLPQIFQYILISISALVVVLTVYNDIRLAGVAWGILAVLLQSIFSACFIFLVLLLLINYIIKRIFRIHNSLIDMLLGKTFSIKDELILLSLFLRT